MKHKFKYLIILFMTTNLLLGVGSKNIAIPKEDTIYKNIYVEGIDISSLNLKEARNLIKSKHKEKSITLKYENNIYTLNPEDIDLSFNIDKAIKDAYSYTRTNQSFENIKRKLNLNFKNVYTVNLIPTYNESKLSNFFNTICKEIDIKEVNASIDIDDSGIIKKSPSKLGKKVNVIKLKENLYNMIMSKNLQDVEIPINIIKPDISTKDVDSINTVLGQFSTIFNHTTSRGSNIGVASNSTSNILLMPHHEFSYNKATGSRTWHNGYKSANVIIGGKYVNGEGGGVCQVSTTIYNAALLSGMDITEVHNHTFISRYAPAGRDAAVSYGYTDFKFLNPLKHPVYIKNVVNNGIITSKIYGCNEDREKLYIITKNKYEKDKIQVYTYRIYLDEEGNSSRKELVSKNIYIKN